MKSGFLDEYFGERLKNLDQSGLLRTLKNHPEKIDFASNDYLGLSRSRKLWEHITRKTNSLSTHLNGATGSRLLTGNSLYTEQVEQKLASIFKSEACLILNSGYNANLAVLSSIPQKDDTIIYDELSHASLKDGARLSLAKRLSFKHNDLEDLERKIQHAKGKIFVVVESVYSMDGDYSPLHELTNLSKKLGFALILDEAHSTGIMGEQGSGMAVAQSLNEAIAIRIYTFGKAMGVHGACVAASRKTIDYLINFARPFIYTTALPPHSIASIDCAFDFLAENISLQQEIKNKIDRYTSSIPQEIKRTPSNSAIQTAILPGNHNVKMVARFFQDRGFDVRPILSPTVPSGSERLRICLHTFNTDQEIDGLIKTFHDVSLEEINS